MAERHNRPYDMYGKHPLDLETREEARQAVDGLVLRHRERFGPSSSMLDYLADFYKEVIRPEDRGIAEYVAADKKPKE